jgi:cytochrome d ubiquinol oxidase subunit I
MGIASWFLLKKREIKFALASIKVAALFGLIASVLTLYTGDGSAHLVAQKQPMKLAAMEGFYEGKEGAGLVAAGLLNPLKESYDDGVDPFIFKIEIPKLLSFFAERDLKAYVPGITNLIEGGYPMKDGTTALSTEEKMKRGQLAIQALANYKAAKKNRDEITAEQSRIALEENFAYFGYGYIKNSKELIPSVGLTFYAFRIMVLLGGFFILLFTVTLFLSYKNKFGNKRWLQWICLISIPLAYIAGQAGWVVAEVGRQPWAIQDILPVSAAISKLSTSSVQITFFIFLALFTVLLIAELKIMFNTISNVLVRTKAATGK